MIKQERVNCIAHSQVSKIELLSARKEHAVEACDLRTRLPLLLQLPSRLLKLEHSLIPFLASVSLTVMHQEKDTMVVS